MTKPEPGPGGIRRAGGPRLEILFEDEDLFAVNKPAGLAAHPGTGITGATLVELVRAHVKGSNERPATEFKPSPAHRLDRETSGVILVAKNRQTMAALAATFESKEGMKKEYLTLAKGKMPKENGVIDLPLSEHEQTAKSKDKRGVNLQPALTRWKVAASMKEAALLKILIETGRTHQIRRHLQSAGHPVAGDARYGDFNFNRTARVRWGLRRMFLHAWKLELPHPVTGREAGAGGAAAGGAARGPEGDEPGRAAGRVTARVAGASGGRRRRARGRRRQVAGWCWHRA